MIEVIVGVGMVVLVVGGLVALALWISRMRATEVKGERREPRTGKEYLSDEDFDQLLIDEGGREDDDAE